ncbi:MAG: phenylalanine--tRNA ligase subunit beta, partial [Myxococcota bacterium]
MRISLDWVGDYVDLPAEITPDQLAYDLTMSTVEVEKVEDLSVGLRDVVVARVQSTDQHPKADRLQVVDVDDGAGGRTVVCGGTNVVQGMLVALALPGARCRGADGSVMEIRTAKVRGVESAGMLCASGELGLRELFPSQGKDIIDLGDLPVKPGTPLAQAIHYDDVVLEIDNKSLTNRPDLWGHHGVARELAALYDVPLKPLPAFKAPRKKPDFDVQIEDEERCGRYTATRIHGVKAAVSPLKMRSRLAKVGQRPINFLVDLTNYVMMAVGQPSHAFDARDVPEQIRVRRARPDEALKLLDDTDLKLDDDCLVIANDKDAVALAGVMGGELAVRDDTSTVLLEMANFNAVEVRRVARRFGLRTESSIRFEKGVDPDRIDLALGLFVELLQAEQSKAKVEMFVDRFARPLAEVAVEIEVEYLHRRLGLEIPPEKMKASLARLGFETEGDDQRWTVRVPSWRATGDVSIPEDIVEEIARLHGYEALGFSPPRVILDAPVIQPRRRMERRIKETLATRAGMREIMTYPWVSTALLDACGLGSVPTLGLAHPPSPDLRLSPSLVPQMLTAVASNLRYSDSFAIFELNRVFRADATAQLSKKEEALPAQPRKLIGAFVGNDSGSLFYRA